MNFICISHPPLFPINKVINNCPHPRILLSTELMDELEEMSSEERNLYLVVKSGVVKTEAALMFDVIYVLAYALQALKESQHPVRTRVA